MILLSVLPSIILFFIVWKNDRFEKEPPKLLWKLFLFGVLTTISATIIETVFEDYVFASLDQTGLIYIFIDNFLIVAVAEEAGKYFVMKRFTWDHPAFNYTFDAIVYSVTTSLGFATFENMLYLLDGSIGTAVTRALFSIPGHAIDALYMGYYYGLAKHASAYHDEKLKKKYLRRAFIVPVVLHGFYDFCLSTDYDIFLLIFLVFEIVITVVAIKKFRKLSKIVAGIPGSEDISDVPETVLPEDDPEGTLNS